VIFSPDFAARFWTKADRTGGPDACWPWTCAIGGTGYGYVWVPTVMKVVSAHRLAYVLTNGAVSQDIVIRHSCDNRPCVNPRHLLAGTQSDNMKDKVSRGRDRTPRGEHATFAKLTEAKVREIQRAFTRGEGARILGRRYGVAHTQIAAIRSGTAWRHVLPVQESPGAAYDPGVSCG